MIAGRQAAPALGTIFPSYCPGTKNSRSQKFFDSRLDYPITRLPEYMEQTFHGLSVPAAVAGNAGEYPLSMAVDISGQANASCGIPAFPPQQYFMGGMGMARPGARGYRTPVRPGCAQYSRRPQDGLEEETLPISSRAIMEAGGIFLLLQV